MTLFNNLRLLGFAFNLVNFITDPWLIYSIIGLALLIGIGIILFTMYRRRTIENYKQMLYEDELTMIKTSKYLQNYFNDIIIEFDKDVSIYYINIDNFKNYNDLFGHHFSNKILVELASRLKVLVNRYDTVYRVHSDHFLVLNRTEEDKNLTFTNTLLKTLNEPYKIGTHEVKLTVSIGRYDIDKVTPRYHDSILRSELALQEAKASGKDQMVIYSRAIKERYQEAFKTYRLIKEAIKERYFFLVFQPVMRGNDLSLGGFEALIRINYQNRTYVPTEIIEYAERYHLIEEIDFFVVKETFKTYKILEKNGVDFTFLSLNISASEIQNKHFIPYLLKEAKKQAVDPTKITIEFTETHVPDTLEAEAKFVKEIRKHGFKVAIDDFGSGYSSMIRLSQNTLDKVKIDKAFIMDISNHYQNHEIVKAIMQLASAFKLETIVEGIENEEDLAILRDLDATYIQGYLFHKAYKLDTILQKFGKQTKKVSKQTE